MSVGGGVNIKPTTLEVMILVIKLCLAFFISDIQIIPGGLPMDKMHLNRLSHIFSMVFHHQPILCPTEFPKRLG